VDELIAALHVASALPVRSAAPPFIFSVDHCFAIKGQGTVLTGTVLHGAVNVNDTIEIPALKVLWCACVRVCVLREGSIYTYLTISLCATAKQEGQVDADVPAECAESAARRSRGHLRHTV
jgi:hypothetical protein